MGGKSFFDDEKLYAGLAAATDPLARLFLRSMSRFTASGACRQASRRKRAGTLPDFETPHRCQSWHRRRKRNRHRRVLRYQGVGCCPSRRTGRETDGAGGPSRRPPASGPRSGGLLPWPSRSTKCISAGPGGNMKPSIFARYSAHSSRHSSLRACVARFLTGGSLPRYQGGSASASNLSRLAQRSHALWPG